MPDQATGQSDKAQDQSKFKIKVDGQETEVTQEKLIEMAQKGADYTKKTQELADEKKALDAGKQRVDALGKIVDEMEQNPDLKSAITKTYNDVKSGKVATSKDTATGDMKLIDKLMKETTDPGEREELRQMRAIVKEESASGDTKALADKITKLEGELKLLHSTATIGLNDRVSKELGELEGDFGKEFMDKHKEDVRAMALKYPKQSCRRILYNLAADDSDFDKVLVERAKKLDKVELERKKKGAGSDATGASTDRVEVPRDKSGRVIMRDFLKKLGEKHDFRAMLRGEKK